jgi:hypothetical protein
MGQYMYLKIFGQNFYPNWLTKFDLRGENKVVSNFEERCVLSGVE